MGDKGNDRQESFDDDDRFDDRIFDALTGPAGIHREPLPEDLPLGYRLDDPGESGG